MKHFLLITITVFCFGIAKANSKRNPIALPAQNTFTVYGINVQKNYEVTFKFFPQKTVIYGPAPKAPSFQNKLMIENSGGVISRKCLRLRSGTAKLI